MRSCVRSFVGGVNALRGCEVKIDPLPGIHFSTFYFILFFRARFHVIITEGGEKKIVNTNEKQTTCFCTALKGASEAESDGSNIAPHRTET